MIFSIRKWGWYLTLLSGQQYKVKILFFRAGKAISLQRHNHRKELWLYLFGRGSMSQGDQKLTTFIRKGGETSAIDRFEWHQFKAEKTTLVLEIQHGGMCREDDIERAS